MRNPKNMLYYHLTGHSDHHLRWGKRRGSHGSVNPDEKETQYEHRTEGQGDEAEKGYKRVTRHSILGSTWARISNFGKNRDICRPMC